MKIHFALSISILLAAAGALSASTNDVVSPLQRGLFEEEANHQYEAAITDYKEAVDQFDHERQLAATAIFRLGECYRKLGRTNEANAMYERIVREFPDQAQFVQLSRGYLPAASRTVEAPESGTTSLPPDEEKFLKQAREIVQNSPDLVNAQLNQAIRNGYVSAADFLIAHGADVKNGSSLGPAAELGNDAMVRLLLSHGADVNSHGWDAGRHTPLSVAVVHGFVTVCQTLIAAGADVNLGAPLTVAASTGNETLVNLLLAHGAEINRPDNAGCTPLWQAIQFSHLGIGATLVAHGADVNTKANDTRSALYRAVENGNLEAAAFLITNHVQIDPVSENGNRPLQVALERGDTNMVKLLLENHADANEPNSKKGERPLLLAMTYSHDPYPAKLLLDHGADPNVTNFGYGKTPLLWALANHSTNLFKLLLDYHADPNQEASIGQSWQLSPLDWAIYDGNLDFVTLLLAAKADANKPISTQPASDENTIARRPGLPGFGPNRRFGGGGPGGGPLFNGPAIANRMPDWESWAVPVKGVPPLMWATWGHPQHAAEIIQLLLEHGAKPDAVDPEGWTALDRAANREWADVVRVLITHGANVNAIDKDGQPPLAHVSLGTESGRAIEKLLIDAGADANYNRRRNIWVKGVGDMSITTLFECPTNSINRYTLLESVAMLYEVRDVLNPFGGRTHGRYAHDHPLPFPDLSRIDIQRLDGAKTQLLPFNVEDILRAGDRSRDVTLQGGDIVEIGKLEHKVADKWIGLSDAEIVGLNKCLARMVKIVAEGRTNGVALVPPIADEAGPPVFNGELPVHEYGEPPAWLTNCLKGRKADVVVRSFLLDSVLHDPSILLNTWDLAHVRLKRGGGTFQFNFSEAQEQIQRPGQGQSQPTPPTVWLEDGDVIEISELGRNESPAGLEPSNAGAGLH